MIAGMAAGAVALMVLAIVALVTAARKGKPQAAGMDGKGGTAGDSAGSLEEGKGREIQQPIYEDIDEVTAVVMGPTAAADYSEPNVAAAHKPLGDASEQRKNNENTYEVDAASLQSNSSASSGGCEADGEYFWPNPMPQTTNANASETENESEYIYSDTNSDGSNTLCTRNSPAQQQQNVVQPMHANNDAISAMVAQPVQLKLIDAADGGDDGEMYEIPSTSGSLRQDRQIRVVSIRRSNPLFTSSSSVRRGPAPELPVTAASTTNADDIYTAPAAKQSEPKDSDAIDYEVPNDATVAPTPAYTNADAILRQQREDADVYEAEPNHNPAEDAETYEAMEDHSGDAVYEAMDDVG